MIHINTYHFYTQKLFTFYIFRAKKQSPNSSCEPFGPIIYANASGAISVVFFLWGKINNQDSGKHPSPLESSGEHQSYPVGLDEGNTSSRYYACIPMAHEY